MILRPLFCFEDKKNTALLIFNSLKEKKLIINFLVERALSKARLLKCSRFFGLWDLVCRPRVPSEDRGNWG